MGLLSAEESRDTPVAWLFVVVQFALLAAIVVLPAGDAWSVPSWLDSAAWVLEALGAAIVVIGAVNLGRSLTPLPSPIAHGKLRERGLYRWVRHPIYSGIIALAVGAAVRSSNGVVLAVVVALIGWLGVKARWEETRLLRRYPGYAAYAARTPRFVPLIPPPGRHDRRGIRRGA